MSQESESETSQQGKRATTTVEVSTPTGVQIVNVFYWIGGLSGIALGVLVFNQGFYETFYDMEILLYAQGIAMAALGAAMFIAATGLTSGATWSLYAAKRVAGIAILWAAVGIALAVFTEANLPGVEFTNTMYGIVGWLIIFGIIGGFIAIGYLSIYGTSVRRFTKYVTQEVITPESTDTRIVTIERPRSDTQVVTVERPVVNLRPFCSHCGAVLGQDDLVCPKCGAAREAEI